MRWSPPVYVHDFEVRHHPLATPSGGIVCVCIGLLIQKSGISRALLVHDKQTN